MPMRGPSKTELDSLPLQTVSRGIFTRREADPHDDICAHHFVGRLSDSITSFTAGWPEIAEASWDASKIIGVMLEFRLRLHRPASPGMGYQIMSGVKSHTDKVRQIIHNFVDPESGLNYASLIAVNGLINLETR